MEGRTSREPVDSSRMYEPLPSWNPARRKPSGDHTERVLVALPSLVICCSPLPSVPMIQISKFPLRFEKNAIRRPSGENRGNRSLYIVRKLLFTRTVGLHDIDVFLVTPRLKGHPLSVGRNIGNGDGGRNFCDDLRFPKRLSGGGIEANSLNILRCRLLDIRQ